MSSDTATPPLVEPAPTAAVPVAPARPGTAARETALGILAAISICHMLNDLMQSVLPATYPILKDTYHLDFGQIGLNHLRQSGDRLAAAAGGRARSPIEVPSRTAAGGNGLHAGGPGAALGRADVRHHPGVRRARRASAHRFFIPSRRAWPGLPPADGMGSPSHCSRSVAISGQSLGPLLAAYIVLPFGQRSIAWFSVTALDSDGDPVQGRHVVSPAHRGEREIGQVRRFARRCRAAASRSR